MTLRPIKIEASIDELFGPNYRKSIKPDMWRAVQETLGDGIFDEKDLDRCKRSPLLTYISFYIRQFAKDGDEFQMSADEAKKFRAWFETGDRSGNPLKPLGVKFFCRDKFREGGKCRPIYIDNESILVVTHATTFNNGPHAGKQEMDREIARAKSNAVKTIYLADHPWASFTSDLEPDSWIFSTNGDHPIHFSGKRIRLIGGAINMCLARSLYHLALNATSPTLTIEIPTDAVYIQAPPWPNANIISQPMGQFAVLRLDEFLNRRGDHIEQMKIFCKAMAKKLGDDFNIVLQYKKQKINITDFVPLNKTITIRFL